MALSLGVVQEEERRQRKKNKKKNKKKGRGSLGVMVGSEDEEEPVQVLELQQGGDESASWIYEGESEEG